MSLLDAGCYALHDYCMENVAAHCSSYLADTGMTSCGVILCNNCGKIVLTSITVCYQHYSLLVDRVMILARSNGMDICPTFVEKYFQHIYTDSHSPML